MASSPLSLATLRRRSSAPTSAAPRRTWPDRILFGVDSGLDTAFYAVHFRFLETLDESFPYDVDDGEPPTQGRWAIHGLGLRDEILRQVYRDNARRLIAFD